MARKIVFVAQQLQSGGLEKAVITLANALAERDDYQISLYIVLRSEPIVPISNKIKVVFLTNLRLKKEKKAERYLRKLLELRAVKGAMQGLCNAVVISSRNEYSTIISKYTDGSNFVIAQLHNDYSAGEALDFKNKYCNVDVFVQLNETFKKEIESIMRKNTHTTISVIPNFIERQVYEDVVRENYVIAVGGFNKVKGFDRLVVIWEKVCETHSNDWKLLIVGDGKEFENIKGLVEEKGLRDKVVLLGRLPNDAVFQYMRTAKIYALSSYSEAFPFVVLEAMYSKLPVVAFDVRMGLKTIIKDGETGFLVRDGDLDGYANKLGLLMGNQDLWQEMSTTAALHSENFLKENVMTKWHELIDSIKITDGK